MSEPKMINLEVDGQAVQVPEGSMVMEGRRESPSRGPSGDASKTSGVGVSFVASISPRSHAYRLNCPVDDPACKRAIEALKANPLIQYLNLDQKKDFR